MLQPPSVCTRVKSSGGIIVGTETQTISLPALNCRSTHLFIDGERDTITLEKNNAGVLDQFPHAKFIRVVRKKTATNG